MEKTVRRLTGMVVSDKMDKTIVVSVEKLKKHPVYKKFVKTRKKYKVHDENNEGKTGDRVMIMESVPVSKEKRWALVKVIAKSED